MQTMPIGKVVAGMIVACNICSASDQVLVPKGTSLTANMIQALVRRGITKITVHTDKNECPSYSQEELTHAEEICRSEVMKRFREKPSTTMMKELFDAVLRVEAVKTLRHG